MINLNGSNVGEMYYGSTKIGEAYLGSDLVYGRKYSETLLWSGDTTTQNQKLNLLQHPSAFDNLKILTYGQNAVNNTIEPVPIYTDYKQLSSFNKLYVGNNFWGAVNSSGVTNSWWFAGMFTGTSGQQWTWTSAYGRNWNTTAYENRYDFTKVREIWGINYGI